MRCSVAKALSTAKCKADTPSNKGNGAASSETAAVAAMASVTPALPPPYHSSPNITRSSPAPWLRRGWATCSTGTSFRPLEPKQQAWRRHRTRRRTKRVLRRPRNPRTLNPTP